MMILMNSKNKVVRTITNKGIIRFYSDIDRNLRITYSKFEEYYVQKPWKHKYDNESEVDRLCAQIRELCEWEDRYGSIFS